MARTQPISPEDQVASFFSVPVVGAHELHITEARRPAKKKAHHRVDNVVTEVLFALDGELLGETSDKPRTTRLEIAWAGPTGPLAQIALAATAESYQTALCAARSLGVGVRLLTYDVDQVFSTSGSRGVLYMPRQHEQLKTGHFQHQITDTAELFDASIGKLHTPGVLSRKVRRKKPVQVFSQYRQDQTWTRIDIQSKKELVTFETRNDEFLGIVQIHQNHHAITTNQTVQLNDTFRGDTNFHTWACERLMTRLGI